MSKHEQNQSGSLIEIVKPRIAAFEDTPLRDPRLSWKAKGIAAYLLSKPPGWQIWTGDLIRRSTDGRDAVLAGLKELETFGYLKRQRMNGEGGRLQWRKTMCAVPDKGWTGGEGDPPSPENPVMAQPPLPENPVMVQPPSPGFPYTAKPSTENPTHSISNCSISNSKEEEEETAAPSEEEVAAPAEKGEEEETAAPSVPEPAGLAVVRRICEDCHIKIAPETVYGYAPVNLIVAEAARWWDETPAHKRAQNAGLLVYRIKTREYAALTQEEIVRCPPYHRWLRSDAEELSQPDLLVEEPKPTRTHTGRTSPYWVRPRDPDDPWEVFVHSFAAENGLSQLSSWLAECAHEWKGNDLLLTPRTDQFTTFVQSRMQRDLAAISSFARRPVTVHFANTAMQNTG